MRVLRQARAYYIFTDFFNAILIAYLPLYVKNHFNYTGSQLGTILLVAGLFSILGILIGPIVINIVKRQKYLLSFEFLLIILGIIILQIINNFYLVLIIVGLCYIARMTMYSIGDNMIADIANKENISFGKFRSFGSIGWGLSFLVNGYLVINHPEIFINLWLVLLVLALINTITIQEVGSVGKQEQLFSKKRIKELSKYRNVKNYLLIACLIYICIHSAPNFINYLILDLDGKVEVYSALTAIFVIIEFITMSVSHRIKSKLTSSMYLQLIGVLIIVKMALITFTPNIYLIYLSTIIDPVIFGLILPFNTEYLKESVPHHLNFAIMSIFGVLTLITVALYSQFAGVMMDIYSSRFVFVIYLGLALIIFVLSKVLFLNKEGEL